MRNRGGRKRKGERKGFSTRENGCVLNTVWKKYKYLSNWMFKAQDIIHLRNEEETFVQQWTDNGCP
jgi:hypothetical protein